MFIIKIAVGVLLFTTLFLLVGVVLKLRSRGLKRVTVEGVKAGELDSKLDVLKARLVRRMNESRLRQTDFVLWMAIRERERKLRGM